MNLFCAVTLIGDPLGMLLGLLTLSVANWDWSIYVLILAVLLLLSTLLVRRHVDEYPVVEEEEPEQTACEYVEDKFHHMR